MSHVQQYVTKYGLTRPNVGLLRDVLCTRCGSRDRFEIAAFGLATVVAVDTVQSFSDVEWTPAAYCRCIACDAIGKVSDFTIPGLDAALTRS